MTVLIVSFKIRTDRFHALIFHLLLLYCTAEYVCFNMVMWDEIRIVVREKDEEELCREEFEKGEYLKVFFGETTSVDDGVEDVTTMRDAIEECFNDSEGETHSVFVELIEEEFTEPLNVDEVIG